MRWKRAFLRLGRNRAAPAKGDFVAHFADFTGLPAFQSRHPIATYPSPAELAGIFAFGAGWSSPVARQAHNLKVVGSNPTPATKQTPAFMAGFLLGGFRLYFV
jgi:hypothetical protein